ncbi:MAG: TrkH family potassium uptake protein [Alphaproteobacteria bacterium]|nr:TrkH family potassium uptake protein [Alphaproteobacteria bacterium]
MLDLRPVTFLCGILIATLGGIMLIPALADGIAGNETWKAFVLSALLTLFIGGAMVLTSRMENMKLNLRQAFLFTGLSWLSAAAFGAIPFAVSNLGLSVTDAFFESMSGITTTGATVMTKLDTAPIGMLLWRSILQWLGGIGIIVFAMAFLPILQVGGMQLFKVEAFDTPEKVLPGAAQIAISIGSAYVLLTLGAFIALWGAGMSLFDAVNHAMTSIATGGFSTKNLSLGYWQDPLIHWIVIICMILGSLPFVFLVDALRGKPRPLLRDTQVHWFITIAAVAVIAVALWLWLVEAMPLQYAFTHGGFNVISMMTGTGYSSADFNQWQGLPMVTLLTLMFVGGCAGSTTCGIKVFRFQVAYAVARTQIGRLLQPHGVFIAKYNRRPIAEDVAASVMGFFFLFVTSFAVLAGVLGLTGLDLVTAVTGAASAIANVGPGLGDVIGPAGHYATLPATAKWALSAGMLLGRLELFTVLVLFTGAFWRG